MCGAEGPERPNDQRSGERAAAAPTTVAKAETKNGQSTTDTSKDGFKCRYCSEGFASRNAMFRHMQNSGCTEKAIADGMPASKKKASEPSGKSDATVTKSKSSLNNPPIVEAFDADGDASSTDECCNGKSLLSDDEALSKSQPPNQGNYLVLGECDFSFSLALTNVGLPGRNLWATSYQPPLDRKLRTCVEKNAALLRKRGATVVLEGVDATDIRGTVEGTGRSSASDCSPYLDNTVENGSTSSTAISAPKSFSRILFTFPRGSTAPGQNREENRQFIQKVLEQCLENLVEAETTEVEGSSAIKSPSITSPPNPPKSNPSPSILLLLNVAFDASTGLAADQWEDWGLDEVLRDLNLERYAVRAFDAGELPGYQPRAEGGEPFVPGRRRNNWLSANDEVSGKESAATGKCCARTSSSSTAEATGTGASLVSDPHADSHSKFPGALWHFIRRKIFFKRNEDLKEEVSVDQVGTVATPSRGQLSQNSEKEECTNMQNSKHNQIAVNQKRLQRHAASRNLPKCSSPSPSTSESPEIFPVPTLTSLGLEEYRVSCALHPGRMLTGAPEAVYMVEDFLGEDEARHLMHALEPVVELDEAGGDRTKGGKESDGTDKSEKPKTKSDNSETENQCLGLARETEVTEELSETKKATRSYNLGAPGSWRSRGDEKLVWRRKERNNRLVGYCVNHRDVKDNQNENRSASNDSKSSLGDSDNPKSNLGFPPFPEALKTLLTEKIRRFYRDKTGLDVAFNVCVLNYYQDGGDHIAWHTDFEEFGRKTPIISLSLGATRQFLLRSVTDREDRIWFKLKSGGLMIMENLCQHRYVHCVPREPEVKEARINLTFRCCPQEYLEGRKTSYF